MGSECCHLPLLLPQPIGDLGELFGRNRLISSLELILQLLQTSLCILGLYESLRDTTERLRSRSSEESIHTSTHPSTYSQSLQIDFHVCSALWVLEALVDRQLQVLEPSLKRLAPIWTQFQTVR